MLLNLGEEVEFDSQSFNQCADTKMRDFHEIHSDFHSDPEITSTTLQSGGIDLHGYDADTEQPLSPAARSKPRHRLTSSREKESVQTFVANGNGGNSDNILQASRRLLC